MQDMTTEYVTCGHAVNIAQAVVITITVSQKLL